MGFKRDQILEALTVCDGDKANALNYLSENSKWLDSNSTKYNLEIE